MEPNLWERRSNLHGAKLINCVLYSTRFFMFDQEKMNNESGLAADILNLLSKQLNFTFETMIPVDGNWGFRRENETSFNGIVGHLQRYMKVLHITLNDLAKLMIALLESTT